jgi:hypothetical protein
MLQSNARIVFPKPTPIYALLSQRNAAADDLSPSLPVARESVKA